MESERGCITYKLLYTKPKDQTEATANARDAAPPLGDNDDISSTSHSMEQSQPGHINQEMVDPNSTQPDAVARNQGPVEHIDSSAARGGGE